MLREVNGGPQVVVCSTCRHSAEAAEDGEGRRGGAVLATALRQVRDAVPALAGIDIEDMPCLFACTSHCAVHIRAPGKIGYVLGGFAPDTAEAAAILAYVAAHAQSPDGVVPYAQWPEGVKGHFIVRVPPEGSVAT